MYATHQSQVAAYAAKSPDNLYRVFQFVQATVNQHFYAVKGIIYRLDMGVNVPILTSRQKSAIQTYSARKEEIYDKLYTEHSAVKNLLYLVSLPGIGIVKSGFILQLIKGKVGCLDRHNVERLHAPKSILRSEGSIAALFKRIQAYIRFCHDYGTARLWDEWCTIVARKYPRYFATPDAVSLEHIKCIRRSK